MVSALMRYLRAAKYVTTSKQSIDPKPTNQIPFKNRLERIAAKAKLTKKRLPLCLD